MKLTQEKLKQIIREELEKAKIEEGFFDFFTGGKKKEARPRIVRGDDPRYHYDQTKFKAASLNIDNNFGRKGIAKLLGYTDEEIKAVRLAISEFPELLSVDDFRIKFPTGQKIPVPKKIIDLERMSEREKKGYRRLLDWMKENDRDAYADEIGIKKI